MSIKTAIEASGKEQQWRGAATIGDEIGIIDTSGRLVCVAKTRHAKLIAAAPDMAYWIDRALPILERVNSYSKSFRMTHLGTPEELDALIKEATE